MRISSGTKVTHFVPTEPLSGTKLHRNVPTSPSQHPVWHKNRLKYAHLRHLGHKMHPQRARQLKASNRKPKNRKTHPHHYQQIFSIRVFTNSSIEMPAARTWAGTRLIGVMPGTVLVSRKKISPSRTM